MIIAMLENARRAVKRIITGFLIFNIVFMMCGLNAYCENEMGKYGNEKQIFYLVPDQRFQSGNMIGELRCPPYAWNNEKKPVYGRVRWFDTLSGIEFEPDMELCGGEGDEWTLIWIFEPDPKLGDYEKAEGIVKIIIVEDEVPASVMGEEFLKEMWQIRFSEQIESENEESEEADLLDETNVEEKISDSKEENEKKDEKIESVSGTTSGSDKVTTIVGYEGSLLNGVGSSITGIGAIGPEYEEIGDLSGEIEDVHDEGTAEYEGIPEYKNTSEMEYPEMITYRGDSLGSSSYSSGNGETTSKSKEKREIPQTGDDGGFFLWCELLGASFCIMINMIHICRKGRG